MLNHVVLIGRLTKDPEMRKTNNGTAVTNLRLAVQRNFTNQNGEKEVDFIDVVTWKGVAENCAKFLSKGRLVAVQGRLQIRQSESNGRIYINPEVVANEVVFLDRPNNENNMGINNMNNMNNMGMNNMNNNNNYGNNYGNDFNSNYNNGYNNGYNNEYNNEYNNMENNYQNGMEEIDVPF